MSLYFKEELFGTPNKLVIDPVHGGIPYFAHESKVIDHPLFQRLRHIVQNDITSLVFPGACHTRFIHSIGAMHIAGRFYKSLVRSYLTDKSRKKSDEITVEQKDAIRYFYYCIRLAALLHDTGHFPFSHLIESSPKFKDILNKKELFDSLWTEDSWKDVYKSKPKTLTHEHFSVRCAHIILGDTLPEFGFNINKEDILAIMETSECSPSDKYIENSYHALGLFVRDAAVLTEISPEETSDKLLNFFKKIISGEIDIDKMDYLLRDSYFSGCRYGIYNIDHLLSTLRIGFYPSHSPWVGLAITKKGLGPLEDFIYSRFQLYQELYNHKTIVGFKWLLEKALNKIINDKVSSEIETFLTKRENFIHFTDSYFWEKFRDSYKQDKYGAAAHLLQRKKLNHVYSSKDLPQFEIDKMQDNLRKKLISHKSPIKFSKIKGAFEDIRVLARNPVTKTRCLESIKDHTDFFDKFENIEITHVYEDPKIE